MLRYYIPGSLISDDPVKVKVLDEKRNALVVLATKLEDTKTKLADFEGKHARSGKCRADRDYVLNQKRDYERTMASIIDKVSKAAKGNPDAGTQQVCDDFLKDTLPTLFVDEPAKAAGAPSAGVVTPEKK